MPNAGDGTPAANSFTNPPPTALAVDDSFFVTRLPIANAPGASMAIVKHGQLVWTKGYGYADIATQRPVTPDTLFMLMSISKTFTATAFLQLAERSALGLAILDQDINVGANLPFIVRNPQFPNLPITYRMLLTHTSGLSDNGDYYYPDGVTFYPGDTALPLGAWLANYLAQPNSWAATQPGTNYAYSNAGASLVGYIIECVTGMNLQAYSQQYLFPREGLNESSWFIGNLDPAHVAMPYEVDGNAYVALGQYGVSFYPASQVRTSALQLARHLVMLAGNGSFGGIPVLAPSTLTEMLRPEFALEPPYGYQGLILYSENKGGTSVVGHSGSYYGVSTDMWFDPATSAGYVLLTNGGAYMNANDPQLRAMEEMNLELLRLAESVP
jgi:CubicO group peptidase (beta-lactamase class C family)